MELRTQPSLAEQAAPGAAEVHLSVVDGPLAGKVVVFRSHQTCVAGRAKDAQLRLSNHPGLSRYHCRFEIHPPQIRVVDMGSCNGTLVNGIRVDEAMLYDGDCITCGTVRVRVTIVQSTLQNVPEADVPTAVQSSDDAEDSRAHVPINAEPTIELSGYRLLRTLGTGGMGTVHLAEQQGSGQHVAIKLIKPTAATGAVAAKLFFREVSTLSQLKHPRIVELLEFGSHRNQHYLVMEYIPILDFQAYLSECSPAKRVRTCVGVICRVLEGLHYAHQRQIVHRDIKPSNLLVFRQESRLHVKLGDFGLAKNYVDAGFSGITGARDIRGTFGFMPPEQALDCRYSKPTCDIFAAGATLYYLLCGERVFQFEEKLDPIAAILQSNPVPLKERMKDIPDALAKAIDRAVSRDPSDRYQSAEEMRAALFPFVQKKPSS